MKDKTCCFTGHRKLPIKKIDHIIKRLDHEIETLINQGVTTFLSGGAIGFDQIAASLIICKKELGANIRLVFILPCRNQDERWTMEQQQLYKNLLNEADEIRYISEEYTDECMRLRNYFMVENSSHCICALISKYSGTAQTVSYAKEKGLNIINVAE